MTKTGLYKRISGPTLASSQVHVNAAIGISAKVSHPLGAISIIIRLIILNVDTDRLAGGSATLISETAIDHYEVYLLNKTLLYRQRLLVKLSDKWAMNPQLNPHQNDAHQKEVHQIRIELTNNIKILRESLRQVKNLRSTVDQVFSFLNKGFVDDYSSPDANRNQQTFLQSLQNR